MYIIMLSDFLQVLYSLKEHYTKVLSFPKHILFIAGLEIKS
jgi:hypothetical protein